MADYTVITDGQVEPEAPVTSELMTALRDNPTGMAEAATGSPLMQQSMQFIEEVSNSTSVTATFTTDLSPYSQLMIYLVVSNLGTGSPADITLQADYGSGFVSLQNMNTVSNEGLIAKIHILNSDFGDGSSIRFIESIYNSVSTADLTTVVNPASSLALRSNTTATAIEALRFSTASGFESPNSFCLYGVKRPG